MPLGRPRQFDADQALDRALKVFWQHGFEGASLTDLTKAMGINRPSLYATFGDKASLFLKAMDRYVEVYASHVRSALEEPTVRRVVESMWNGSIGLCGNSHNPRGCFLVQGALVCSAGSAKIQHAIAKARRTGEEMLMQRFEHAIQEGELDPSVSASDLARYVSTVSYGLAVQASGGSSAKELAAVAAIALRGLPK